MICLEKNEINRIEKFSEAFHDTTSFTVLQGIGGTAWTDQKEDPKVAITMYGDFCFLAGEPQGDEIEEELMSMLVASDKSWVIFVPESDGWLKFFQKSSNFHVSERYRLKKEGSFDKQLLQKYIDALPKEFQIERIDEKWYSKLGKEQWGKDLCYQFASSKAYAEHGIGFLITTQGEPVAGVSSYSYYDKGIEIEIDTKESYRKRGFATILGARIILECVERGLYPSWDAANMISVKTAEKLGYVYDGSYPVFSNVELRQMKLDE